MSDKTKEYSNGEVKVLWKSSLCKHAAACVKNSPNVFRPTERPWIDISQASTEELINTVSKCPSGALTYRKES